MSRFQLIATPLSGLKVVQRLPRGDSRGFFSRFFCAEELREAGFNSNISQINHTLTHETGTVRGLHYQVPPHAEIKLVSCLRGEILDVAVDLRAESPTFLQWHAVVISAENQRSLLIPQGFAHGFQTLTDDCELIYLHSAPYIQSAEASLNVFDPKLGISWPLPVTGLSEKDQSSPLITHDFEGINA